MVAAHVWLQSFDNGGDDVSDTLPLAEAEIGCLEERCCEEFSPVTDREEANASADGKGEPGAVVVGVSAEAPNEPTPTETSDDQCDTASAESDEKRFVDSAELSSLLSPIGSGLAETVRRFERLESAFETKLACDAHQQTVIDRLHAELQTHKDGLALKLLQPLALDLISMVDDIGKTLDRNGAGPDSAMSAEKLLNNLAGLRDELEIILERYGFVAAISDGDVFDPQSQRAARRVSTTDSSLDRKIERRIGKSYSFEGRPIRPELVSVYRAEAIVTVASNPPSS